MPADSFACFVGQRNVQMNAVRRERSDERNDFVFSFYRGRVRLIGKSYFRLFQTSNRRDNKARADFVLLCESFEFSSQILIRFQTQRVDFYLVVFS